MSWLFSLVGGVFLGNSVIVVGMMILLLVLFNLNMMGLYWDVEVSGVLLKDNLSLSLIMLTVWICLIVFIMGGVWQMGVGGGLVFGISSILILCFLVSSIFMFYVFFEMVLVPMFLLVVLYGNYSERVESGFYMMFYTMFGSLPLLMSLVGGFGEMSWDFVSSILNKGGYNVGWLAGFLMLMAFLSKLPMYGFHIWLPKAHVEAPVVGSMILAGVLLKLGGYGILRVLCLLEANFISGSLVVVIGIVGGINCGLACLRQNDSKKLVAYSSVVHMGMSLSGMMTCLMEGWGGSVMSLICHGLISSGLFFFVNMISERVFSRSIMVIKGCGGLCPNMSMWCFLLLVVNSGCPPFLGFFSESLFCMGLLKWNLFIVILLSLALFISVGYNIYLYSVINHGNSNLVLFYPVSMKEYLLLFLHFYPVVWFVMGLDSFSMM